MMTKGSARGSVSSSTKAQHPKVRFDTCPLTRLALQMFRRHWPNWSMHDQAEVFCVVFQKELREWGFEEDLPTHRTMETQWHHSKEPRFLEKWAPIVKGLVEMTDREVFAYIWLYDLVKGVAITLEKQPPEEALYSDDEDEEDEGAAKLSEEEASAVDEMVETLLLESKGVIVREADGKYYIGIDIALPEGWAGTKKSFFAGKEVQNAEKAEQERAALLDDVRRISKRKMKKVARARLEGN